MKLYECVQALARHLGLRAGRVQTLAGRLQEAGLLTKCIGSRRYPVDVSPVEVVLLFITALAETGIGTARATAETFAALTDPDGGRLDDALHAVLFTTVPVDSFAIRQSPPGASLTVNGATIAFGDEPDTAGSTAAIFVPGQAIDALRADLIKQ